MVFLGVDGGGTKTSFILINEKGQVRSYVKKKSCHYLEHGMDGFKNVIKKGIEKVCNQAGIEITDITYSFL